MLWYVGDEGVVAVASSYGADEAVGQTNVCARRKRLNFQGVCTVRETTVDLQVHALLFFHCVYFCSIFTCFGTLEMKELSPWRPATVQMRQ